MNTRSWSEFEVRMPVKADVKTLYDAWTTQTGIERWFLRSAIYTSSDGTTRKETEEVKKDDMYRWLWHGYPDHVMENNPVLDANGKDLFQFVFTGKCIVTVKLKPINGITMVSLHQGRIPEDNNPATNLFVGCQLGWTFYLTNLKSIMEGGIDLRNRDEALQSVINS
jgi:uncharacterized protein YndB with AHSA1/START domain